METRAFLDKSIRPDDRRLKDALGPSAPRWEEIRSFVRTRFGDVTEEWKHYGGKSGWTLKTLYRGRNLFFFSPWKGSFRIAFVFGDRGVAAVETSVLPEGLIAELKSAKKYAEGRGLRIEVNTKADVRSVLKLIEIKAAN